MRSRSFFVQPAKSMELSRRMVSQLGQVIVQIANDRTIRLPALSVTRRLQMATFSLKHIAAGKLHSIW